MGTFVAKIGKHNLKSFSLFKNKLKFKFESESEIFEEFTMQLLMDEKGRSVINVPFQMLSRNKNWNEKDQKPYLPPAEKEIIPVEEPQTEDKLFLGLDDEPDTDDPEAKKRKLHFGGLNFKKKVE